MKKALCLIVSFTLMVSALMLPVGAVNEADAEAYDGNPLVVVRGIDFTGLYAVDGSSTFNLELSDIFTFAKKYLQQHFIEKNDEAFLDCALELVQKAFEPISVDREGNSVYWVEVGKFRGSMASFPNEVLMMEDSGETGLIKTAVDKMGAENVYYYTYDWRMSAKKLAADLDEFIKLALDESGKDKVNIAAVSMGGMVTTSYLYHYGAEKIDSLVYVSGAHNGTYGPGDAFNGNIYIDGDVIYQRIRKSFAGKIIPCFFVDLIDKIGAFDAITLVANKIIKENPQAINNDIVRDGFGTFLGLWAMCPDDVFESGVEFLFGGYEDEYPAIIKALEETGEFIYSTEETIDNAINSGAKVSFISNYNTPLAPYFTHSYLQGDGVLETMLTSNFATVAPYGETLTAEQLAKADETYVSPDRMIDATTALYRDSTWFVRDAVHVATIYESDYADFVMWLLLCDEQPTVKTNPAYPQFMAVDSEKRLVAAE